MYVHRLRLTNYSSFEDTGWITLSPTFNVVTGQNNSGKSALLQAIGPTLQDRPHRNAEHYLPGDLKVPEAFFEIQTSTSEIRQRLAETGTTVLTQSGDASVNQINHIRALLEADTALVLQTSTVARQSMKMREATFKDSIRADANYILAISVRGGNLEVGGHGGGQNDTMIDAFTTGDQPAFFSFTAQRHNVATNPFSTEKRLAANAANLPAVLGYLSGSQPDRFEEIEARVAEVISGVGAMRVTTEDGNLKILLWPSNVPKIRELAFDLDHSGTGVAQVIAIVTAVVTSPPSVMCIDEINSYLHPSAVKQLLQICTAYYPQHQYIVSTHSADVMSFHDIDRLFAIDKEGFKSVVRSVDRSDLSQVRDAFRNLGIGMSDVLGADRVIWVEGPTEELVFPELLRRASAKIPQGLRFASVAATGDFSRRGGSKKAVVDLYSAVMKAVAPLTNGSAFVLDRESLSDTAVQDVARQTDGRLQLLGRRCLECYALNPTAISSVINTELSEELTSPDSILSELKLRGGESEFGAPTKWKGDIYAEDWLKRVDAARLLKRLFQEVTASRLEFRKTSHTPRIFAAMESKDLKELSKLLLKALSNVSA